jgi:K+-sensing histidine kinase KdpD
MSESNKTTEEEINEIAANPAIANILDVICQTTGMGFATVARVTEEKWVAYAVKDNIDFKLAPGGELELKSTLCHEIFGHHEPIVIDDFSKDESYADHHTSKCYGLKSYISYPIFYKNGEFFGTLCAIDPNPAKVKTTQVMTMFGLFADLIAFHLNSREAIKATENQLREEREEAKLREQFMAILGHDLRNPVGAISNAAQLQLRQPLDERSVKLATLIYNSSKRTLDLIDNMLDLARGQLGGGLKLDYNKGQSLTDTLTQVISELQTSWPAREIVVKLDLNMPIACDHKRVAQLFSNLLANALSHGDLDKPIFIHAGCKNNRFELSVTNASRKIPQDIIDKLFKPFYRGEANAAQEGLGLGLYIASQIALAHGGSLTVTSTDESTCFTFNMPFGD